MPVLEPAQVAPVKEVGEDPVTLRVPRSGRAVGSRRKDILQTLAKLLEDPQCDRITTALIAKKLKLSEAALYRSFPSKGAMFDALIGFIESSLLDLFAQIRDDDALTQIGRVQMMVSVMLDFSDANPGLTRVMTGQVLMKLEMGLRQTLREAVLAQEVPANFDSSARAGLLMNWVLGRWLRFVMTSFAVRPNGVSAAGLDPFLKP